MAGKRSNSTSNIGCLSFQLIALKDIDSNLTRLKGSPKLGKAVEKRRHEMEPYLNQKTSVIFTEMQVGTSRVYKSKSVKLYPRGKISFACIFDEFFSINLHMGDLSQLAASQKNPTINIRIFCQQKKNNNYPILLGLCKIPFIHLNESMVEENVQIKLNSNLFAVFNDGTTITPILQCKVQWSMSMSQNDFDAILLKEVVSENVRFSSKAAAIVHNESLSLSVSNQNFLRFIVASEEMFNAMDLILAILLWQKPAITTLLLMIINILCLYGLEFAVVGPLSLTAITLWFFVNPSSYINSHFTKKQINVNNPNNPNNNNNNSRSNSNSVLGHRSYSNNNNNNNTNSSMSTETNQTMNNNDNINQSDYIPRSLRSTTLAEKLNNFKSIQNFMKLFSDLIDGIFYFFEVSLNDPLMRIKARTTLITSVIVLVIFIKYIPTHMIWLMFWWGFFLFGNPYVQAIFAIIRFKIYRMKESTITTHDEYIHEKFDNQRDKAFITTEYTRWWVGAGWKLQSFHPKPMEKVSLPEHLKWKGLWEVDLYDDDHEYEYNSGFVGDTNWHEVMKSGDFLRRRRWIRRVKKARKKKNLRSNSNNNNDNINTTINELNGNMINANDRMRTFSTSSNDSDSSTTSNGVNNDEMTGTIIEFVIFENERWWVGTGFRHKFWPHEKIFKFTDNEGNPKTMKEIDQTEKVLQSDGNSHWIDHWHIVDEGWHYATDFSDLTKFKRKDKMSSWDYCRRRKWVRNLKKKV